MASALTGCEHGMSRAEGPAAGRLTSPLGPPRDGATSGKVAPTIQRNTQTLCTTPLILQRRHQQDPVPCTPKNIPDLTEPGILKGFVFPLAISQGHPEFLPLSNHWAHACDIPSQQIGQIFSRCQVMEALWLNRQVWRAGRARGQCSGCGPLCPVLTQGVDISTLAGSARGRGCIQP